MHRRVLIPTDFSKNAENAVRYAFQIFEDSENTEFVLLNAYDIPRGGSNTMLVSITDILKRYSVEGLNKCLKKMRDSGVEKNIRLESRHGSLSSVIQEMLKQEKFNLVVMGTLGAGGLKKVLLGSNTSDVVKRIKRPILIVPHEARYSRPDNILITTDFKKVKRDEQIEKLREFALSIDAKISVLNVHDEGKNVDMEEAMKTSGLADLLEGLEVTCYDEENDDVIEGIDNFVKNHDIKIIAMIVRELNFLDSLFHKSLTKQMAMRTQIPMLALHG